MSNPLPVNLQGMWDWAYDWTQRSDCAYDQSYRNYQRRPSDGKYCFDCSSFTFFALWLGGGLDVGYLGYNNNLADYQAGRANAWNVTMMINSLTRYAGWETYSPQTETWQFGDILAKTRTHTEIFYAPQTYTMGAVNSTRGITITDYSRQYYDVLLRWPGSTPGPTPPPGPTLPMPIWLLKRAIENQKGGILM